MWRCVALVRTNVSEKCSASIILYVPPKRRFLQDPHSATSQKTTFFKTDIACATAILFFVSAYTIHNITYILKNPYT
jgi:hypothetical protein